MKKKKKKNEDLIVLDIIDHPGGWSIVPIHYSHDPEKSSDEWKTKAMDMYDRAEDWEQEMELDFTAQLGALAYPAFNQHVHVKDKLKYNPSIPLRLACDFNVDPCIFEVCQIVAGRLLVLDEIVLSPADIPKMISEFRNSYPDHNAGLYIYGDSNGLSRTSQTMKTDYELMQIHLQGYPSEITMRVPRAHPNPRARINSLNHKLKGYDGKPMMFISKHCKELIQDLQQVVLKPNGRDVLKTYKAENPYAARTHASDAVSYLVHREWPVAAEAVKLKMQQAKGRKPRPPLSYGNMLGQPRRS